MKQGLLPPMEWLRNSGWGRNISSLAKGDYRKASNEHLWQVFMDRTDDPVTSFVGVARHEAAYGQTGYEAARELAGSAQEELDALAAGMSCECAIANALIPFVEDGQRIVALGRDLVHDAERDGSRDLTISDLLGLKRCFYIHLDDTTAKGENGMTLDGILVVGGADQPPSDEDPEGTSIITEIMPFVRDMAQPGADSPRSLGVSIRPDTQTATISEALREGARDVVVTAKRLLANDDGEGGAIIDEVEEGDKPRMGLIRLLERNIEATIRYADLVDEQADAWARIIGQAILCMNGRGPVGLTVFDEAAPQDLVAKVRAGGTGANKARQKLSGLGHVPMTRYEIGNVELQEESSEPPCVAEVPAVTAPEPLTTSEPTPPVGEADGPRIDRRKARRESRRRIEEASMKAKNPPRMDDARPVIEVADAEPVASDEDHAMNDQPGPTLPQPVFVRSAGPAKHDPVAAQEVEHVLGRCFKDLPSIHSRNWEATMPPALASMVMRRARVDQMPHERPDGTRKRLASEILPRMEGAPDILARLVTEKNANPGLHRTLSVGRASIMRDIDIDIAEGLVHPAHVVVGDDALTERLLFPGVKRQPVHGALATTVVIAWRRDRILHLIGIVHEGCMIGLRRIEYDLDEDEVTVFDTESDVLDPRDLLDMLWAPVADALLGPVDEWEAWRFERRERKTPRSSGPVVVEASMPTIPADEPAGDGDENHEETIPAAPQPIDFGSWPALTRPFGPLDIATLDHLSTLMDGNAVSRAVLDFADREPGENVHGAHNATLRQLASIASNPSSRFAAMTAPEIDERDLSSCDDADGVVVVNDRALYEHASPGIAGLGLPRRENAMCILYRMRRDGISALTLQMEPDGELNLAQWSRIGLVPKDEDDDLTWYVRGVIAAATCVDEDATPEEQASPASQTSPLPRMETQPISEIVQAFPRRVDDEDEDVLPRRVIAQVRLRPGSMHAAVKATTAWFDATAERHRIRLVADRREEGAWTIEHRSEDRLNPSIWSTTVRLAPDEQGALDIILRTTMTAGVRPRLPILVRDIAEATPTEGPDGLLLLDPPTVTTRNDMVHLLRELQSPDRVLPILVMSEDRDGKYMRDPCEIARQSLGALTIWKVAASATYDMTDALGQEYRTFYGAVRLFQPRFDPDNDNAAKHPRIVNDAGSERAMADMISRVTAATVTRYAIPEASVVRTTPSETVPAAAIPRNMSARPAPIVVPTPPKVPVRAPTAAPATSEPVVRKPAAPAAQVMVTPASTVPAPAPRTTVVPERNAAADAPADPRTAGAKAPATGRTTPAARPALDHEPETTAPAPQATIDPAAVERMVSEIVNARMKAMEPEIQKRIDVAVEAAKPESPPAEPMLDLPVPAAERHREPDPEPKTAPLDDQEIDRRVEIAVARRFSGLGIAELLGSVTTLVTRMDDFVVNAAKAPQPVIVHQGTAEAEAQWAAERTAFETLLSEAGEETGTANAERDAAVAEVQKLRQALNELRRDGVVRKGADERRWPENLDGLADWLEANPLPNVVVTTKAYRGMRKIRYEDMERLCRTLELLNGPYVDMRAGEPGARDLWEEGLKELRLESKKQTQMGKGIRGGAEYRFEHEARRWEMDYHIRGNESVHNEHDRLLRIYFAYDKEEGRVLIGHMPTHLTTIDS